MATTKPEQFKLADNERVLMEGKLCYFPGEWRDVSVFKIKMLYCGGILTNKRFVVWEKPQVGPPFTPLVWLFVRLFKGRPILACVPLEKLSSIEIGPGTGFTLMDGSGPGVRIASDGFFDQREKWLKAISEAVAAACPGKKARKTETLLEFAGAPA